jgi:integrase
MQTAFAAYADSHEAASIRRCWSNWNTLCDFLYAGELITGNPMPLIGRPKVAKTLPKGLGAETIAELLRVIYDDCGSGRRSDWAERDRAIVLTAVLAGLRADELVRADVGHIRLTGEGGVIHVHGKGNKDRRIPVERALIHELEAYLDSRQSRFPGSTKRRPTNSGLAAWPATAPLFVGSDGQRITRGTLPHRTRATCEHLQPSCWSRTTTASPIPIAPPAMTGLFDWRILRSRTVRIRSHSQEVSAKNRRAKLDCQRCQVPITRFVAVGRHLDGFYLLKKVVLRLRKR